MVGTHLKSFVNSLATIADMFGRLLPILDKMKPAINFMINRLADFQRIGPLAFTPPGWGALRLWDKIFGKDPAKPDIPPLPGYDQNNGARLFDPMSFFGKGAGDQWSKIGAFSFTGGTNPISVGIAIQREIANNTKEAATYLKNMARAAVPFTMNSAPVSPVSGWDSTPSINFNNPFNANTAPSLNRGY